MTDEKLRALERRWKESGAVEDEGAYLRERVRVGDLEPKRLELAACFGYEAAQAALTNAEGLIRPPAALDECLSVCDREACIRMSIAVARLVRPRSDDICDARPRYTMEKIEQNLFHSVPLDILWIDQARAAGIEPVMRLGSSEFISSAGMVIWDAALCCVSNSAKAVENARKTVGSAVSYFLRGLVAQGALKERRQAEEQRILEAIAPEMIPWALGYRDPVRERVEARQNTEPSTD